MRKRMSDCNIGGADQLDAIVVGAGFAGLHAWYKLRMNGLRVPERRGSAA
jgi:cation diffusion facilitator CzcD-associated flavoprotein CzcO